MTRMGYTGRAPAPDGSQSAWGACQSSLLREQAARSRAEEYPEDFIYDFVEPGAGGELKASLIS
jgi:hypothetical protein